MVAQRDMIKMKQSFCAKNVLLPALKEWRCTINDKCRAGMIISIFFLRDLTVSEMLSVPEATEIKLQEKP